MIIDCSMFFSILVLGIILKLPRLPKEPAEGIHGLQNDIRVNMEKDIL